MGSENIAPDSEADTPEASDARPARQRRSFRRRLIRWAPRTIGIVILLLLAFLGVDLMAGVRSLAHARPDILIVAFSVFSLGVVGRMITWMLVAYSVKLGYSNPLSLVRLFLVGMIAGLGIPTGAASLARLSVVASDGRSVGRGAVAVGLERMFQAAAMVILLIVSSLYLSVLSLASPRWILLSLVAILAVIAVAFVMVRLRLRVPFLGKLMSLRIVSSFIDEAKAAVIEVRHTPPQNLAAILLTALAAALFTIGGIYFAARSLDLPIPFMVLMAAWAAVGLTGLLPISINGLGPREGILTAAVAGIGFGSEGGVALGLLWFAMQTVSRLMAGLLFFTVLAKHRESQPVEAPLA